MHVGLEFSGTGSRIILHEVSRLTFSRDESGANFISGSILVKEKGLRVKP